MIVRLLYPYAIAVNTLYLFSKRISGKIKRVLFSISVMVISFLGITTYSVNCLLPFFHLSLDSVLSLSVACLFIILLTSIDSKISCRIISKGSVNPLFWAAWFICFGSMLLTSMLHRVSTDYFWWIILSLTVFPMIMLAWSNHHDLYGLLITFCRSIVLISYVYYILTLLITPFSQIQRPFPFAGLNDNSNGVGLVCLTFFTAALFLLLFDSKNSFLNILSMILCLGLSVISVARASLLAIILISVIVCILYITDSGRKKVQRPSFLLMSVLIAGIITVLYCCIAMNLYKLDIYALAAADTEYAESLQWVESSELRSGLNSLSSGRLLIWKAYSNHLTFFGNGSLDGPLIPGIPSSFWAHNNAIDIWYISGFPAFMGYCLLCLSGFVFIIKVLKKKIPVRPVLYLAIPSFLAYFTIAMLEITIYPMTTGIAFLSFMTLFPFALTPSDPADKNISKK